jgi:hypothetical protein
MGLCGIGMETVSHGCPIAAIDAPAVPEDEFGDLLLLDHCSDREVSRGEILAGP